MPIDGLNPESGLEDRLRGLIFTNQTPQIGQVGPSTGIRGYPAGTPGPFMYWDRDASSETPAQTLSNSHRGTHSPRTSRRRPNQAQRRQIGNELSISMASHWNTDQSFQQPDLQHNRSASHPLHLRGGVRPTVDRAERQPPGRRPQSYAQSTAWCNPSTASPPPMLAGSRTNLPHQPNWYSDNTLARHNTQYFPDSPLQNDRRQSNPHAEAALLDKLCHEVVRDSEIDRHEISRKENFRQQVEIICQQVIYDHECQGDILSSFPKSSVELKCFGSMSSGFATKSSDMDLGLLSPFSKVQPDSPSSPIPRLIEKRLLEAGYGARLLSRARVPIIKLCESPSEDLRCALLVERAKWERGADSDMVEGREDKSQDPNSQPGDMNSVKESEAVVETTACTELPLTAGQSHSGIEGAELKQTANSSLKAYYSLAKRVLRRCGGRDITVSRHRDFSSSDWAILNRVCQAFVQGLYDELLRRRLESRLSLSFKSSASGSFNRSLAGVFTQMEGERILLDWEHSLAKDALQGSTGRVDRIIKSWVEVQNKSHYGDDPLGYNRDLSAAFELLRCQPEIQLMRLAQKPKETPTEYYYRAYNLVCKLDRSAFHENSSSGKQFVLAYISGIQDESVRKMMNQVNADENISFHQLGQKHKCLQLAHELEIALNHQSYDENLTRDISEYIRLLKTSLVKVNTSENQVAFRIPVTEELLPILSRIRLLSDPHTLAINQPPAKFKDPLEFPSSGVGVQCDINFSAHLALQNTKLLRCYSLTDPRVRPMVLFIKKWAKVRGINSGYRGTLSSYGFVLMVLHFLVNVAKPFVCPNLQHLVPTTSEMGTGTMYRDDTTLRGYNVQFWQNEPEIRHLAANCQLTYNTETLGHLIRGFFEYFAQSGPMGNGLGKGFDWGRDVLSLRTHGGLLTKQEKGWTGAKTVVEGHNRTPTRDSAQSDTPIYVKEIRHRYLFAIEDPFELDHNVARTVTHNGIVAIRDEFRRAWRLIRTCSRGWSEDLLSDVTEPVDEPPSYEQLLEDIHGPKELW
ncbi:hypothetical protein E4U42_007763 [Claviceps africana]|uniref:polynucleotide adenylyltransferase n=1 Tax=Claviceps africana TaxID=83212 RepID=A0A8K0JC23_9HYPO|nr:hypothetical protein E4U42_007763 [Claviceps africana]